jgi:hypothetical protein
MLALSRGNKDFIKQQKRCAFVIREFGVAAILLRITLH